MRELGRTPRAACLQPGLHTCGTACQHRFPTFAKVCQLFSHPHFCHHPNKPLLFLLLSPAPQNVHPEVAAIAEEAPEEVLEAAEAKDDPVARFVLARILSQTAAHSHLEWDTLVDGARAPCMCLCVLLRVLKTRAVGADAPLRRWRALLPSPRRRLTLRCPA